MKRTGKRKLIVQGIVFALLILTALLMGAMSFHNGNIMDAGIGLLVAVLFGVFAAKFMKDQHENMERGMPQEDERSERIKQKAGYYTFLISIYMLLAIGAYSDMSLENPGLPQIMDISQATGLAIGLMALTFGMCWWYFNSKGDA